MVEREQVLEAHARIGEHIRRTPTELSHALSAAGNCRVHLKLENFQRTGSFKLRGAMNCMLANLEGQVPRGFVAASTGNHGAAIAYGAAKLGCRAHIFAPRSASPSKLEQVRAHGADVQLIGEDCLVAEQAARTWALEEGWTYVSPYNDEHVIAGQGTLGLELQEDVPRLDALFIAVGGGGLLSGVAGSYRGRPDSPELVACSPRRSAVMHASLAAGRILELDSDATLSEGTAGGVEPGSVTFELCRRRIDRFVLVEEAPIAAAIRLCLAREHLLVEGAAAMAIAAFLQEKERWDGREVGIVVCGGNLDFDLLQRVISAPRASAPSSGPQRGTCG